MSPDFISANQGSIVTLTALTQRALDWVDLNLDDEASPHLATVDIDSRYFLDIAIGLLSDGLSMQDANTGRMASIPE